MDPHHDPIPRSIGALVERLSELEVVFGPRARPPLERVRTALIAAMAARDRRDEASMAGHIGRAMHELARLAEAVDPEESTLMRALADSFRAALLRNDAVQAHRAADLMMERSGATPRKKG